MPVIAHCPPAAAIVRPFWMPEASAISQGFEGRLLRDQIEIVSKHWQQQFSEVHLDSEADLLEDLENCGQVPFKNIGKARVRVTRIGKLLPRELDLNEELE